VLTSNTVIPNLVIGSGPTGYATALSLLDQGKTVYVIDPNVPLFPTTPLTTSVSAQKALFGSREMYTVSKMAHLDGKLWGIPYSEVRGGLSTTWGAGLQVYPDKYFLNWPCKGTGMQSAYQRILSEIDHIQTEDALTLKFPWPSGVRKSPPPESKLGELGNSNITKYSVKENILIGHARLAISRKGIRECQLCSECLEGCPYDSIFNSGNELLRLAATNNRLHLVSGFVQNIRISNVRESNLIIKIVNSSGELSIINAEHTYLALGAIGTPALLLRSGIVSERVEVRDSQVFYVAFFSFRKLNEVGGISLAKLFVVNKNVGANEFHLSLYSPNLDIARRIEDKVREIVKVRVRIPKFVTNRIIAGIGFIDPAFSGKIVMQNKDGKVFLEETINPKTKEKISETLSLLSEGLRKIGLFKIPFTTQIPDVGAGFHSGGGLVDFMTSTTSVFDETGRLRRNSRLIVTDASSMVFNIAGPHTLTAMAHAYRNVQTK